MKCIFKNKARGLFTDLVETWKDIEGFEGHYQISSLGNVKSLERMRESSHGNMAHMQERILKQKTGKCGYKVIGLCKENKKTHPSVHRLVALSFIPNVDNKDTVNHIDCDKTNNKVSNLEWSTHTEQMKHAVENDLLERRGAPKYSPSFKRNVHDYFIKNSCSISQLAKTFNISERTAGRISHGIIDTDRKISNESVELIKAMRLSGATLESIAKKMNCGISQVHRITRNQSRNLTYSVN
jgi:NUMOD4 motif/HNH endonuclease